jgi:CubicO group peptidase (beta-lactamase class C family)
MTATALVKLMEDCAVSWDTRLLDLFPEFAASADPAYREITLAEIAVHRAGFPSGGDVATLERLRNNSGSLTEYLGEILRQRPRVRRGRFLYSNSGYAALGAAIERCTGLSYAEAMEKILFEPMSIKAQFGFPAALGPDQPWGHTSNWGAAATARPIDQFIPVMLWPAGGVSLTLGDFARFVQLHLRGMLGQADSGYSPDMIRQLHKTQLVKTMPVGSYAAGWVLRKVSGEMIQWHNGSAGNFMVYMAINRDRKKGIVVVSNVGGRQGDRAGWDIIKTMLTGGS